jgi:hypothetical protein
VSTTFLRLFDAAALARALRDEGHEVSERTAQRWKAGTSTPKPQDLAAIRRLLGEPERAALPDWAERLMAGVMALEEKGGVSDEELAKAEARAALWAAFAEARKRPRRGDGAARKKDGA